MAEMHRQGAPVLVLGEALVEFMPARMGQGMGAAFRFEKYAGGAPATYAAALVRLGLSSSLLTRLGTDPFSTFLLAALAAEGVDTSQVKRLPNRQVGLCFHECIDGMTSLIFYRRDSVATTLSPEDIDVETIRQAVALHVLGTTFQISESAMQTCLKAIRLAREAGIVVSFDPNIRNILGSTETDRAVEEALSTADLVMPTLEEAEAITGQSDPFRAARELRARGPQLVAVTLAGEGAVLLGEGEPILCPGYEVEMVEPTGAGDVHAAALLVGFLHGWDPAEIGRFANAAGAQGVMAMGHMGPALPTMERTRAVMKKGAAL
jgi:sugar/nucleoside kinase (ribokinase family)